MKRSVNQEIFIDTLIRLSQKIIHLGKLNILSNHLYSENFFKELLNKIYFYSLENQNKIEKNAQAFDLIDKENNIIIQVSSTCSKQKIENTLKKDIIKEKKKENFRLKFLFIGEQNKNIKNKSYINPYNILFNPKEDILLIEDLNEQFLYKDVNQQSEIIELLNQELSPILFVDTLSYLDDKFIDEKLEFSISNLVSRYSKENDINTNNNKVMEAISISDNFKSKNLLFLTNIKNYIEKGIDDKLKSNLALDIYSNIRKELEELKHSLNFYLSLDISFEHKIKYLNKIYKSLNDLISITDKFEIYNSSLKEDEQKTLLKFLGNIEHEATNYSDYLQETCSDCLFNPYLLIQGRAGIGKSHLLGHIARKLRKRNHITYLMLGQFFKKNEDPWNQILNSLDIKSSINNFLWAVDSKAKELNKRAFIIIDALNEGEGRMLWENYFQSFFNWLNKYPNIAFIFSIRTPFEDIILPKDIIKKNNISTFMHKGFSDEGYEPIRSFCNFYGLESPSLPILNTEYENPLFLKLACEYYKDKNKIFEQSLNISELFNNVIDTVNINLSKAKKFDFDQNLDVVYEVIQKIIELIHHSDYRELKYKDAYKNINDVAKEYVQRPEKFLEALIDENILTKSKNYNEEMIVYFSYERMGDYLLANYLLKNYKEDLNNLSKIELIQKMKSDSKIIKYFKTENNILYNKGVIEELTIKIAEEYKIELFEIFPEYKENSVITEALISSLVWRTKNCINTTTKNYINELVIPYKPYREYFLDVMLMKVSQQNHPLNAFHLDKLLKVTTLSIRDYFWTQYISRYNDKAFKIVDWVYDNSHKLNKEVAELYIITLVWLFTTTNKKLRNKSTKSLVKIFSKFPSLVVKTLKLFENNDDAYLVERLYASVYGGVVRSDGRDEYIDIANYIYSVVFEKKLYVHIFYLEIMRDKQ